MPDDKMMRWSWVIALVVMAIAAAAVTYAMRVSGASDMSIAVTHWDPDRPIGP
jgi:hypothetical protein